MTNRLETSHQTSGCVLGIDLGSTWCKAAYLDQDGQLMGQGRASTRGSPAFGFSADDLENIWAAVRHAVDRASKQLRAGGHMPAPAGIALSTRHGSGLWLDAHNRAIELAPGLAPDALEDIMTAVYSAPHWDTESLCTYAPVLACRTLYLRQHNCTDWRRVRRVGALHDGLLLRLTGRWATNPSTGPGRTRWPSAISVLCGIPVTAFPKTLHFGTCVGPLTVAAARDLGLPPAIPVAAGYHDGAAATVGAGILEIGDSCITLGTSAALRIVACRPVVGWFGYPLAEERWAWSRGVNRALADVDAVAAELDGTTGEPTEAAHTALTAAAAMIPPGAHGLSLPIGVPGQDARSAVCTARATGHAAGTIYRAALEGVALRIRDLISLACEAGMVPRRYVATGGAARNNLLLGILSAVLARPVESGDVEAGVRGASVAAAVAARWYPTIVEAAGRMGAAHESVVTSPEENEAYRVIAATRVPVANAAPTLPFWRCLPT